MHVGAGTFQPVRFDTIEEHQIHSEHIIVPATVCEAVMACRDRAGRVVAVGITSAISLALASRQGSIEPFEGDTDIFIYSGHTFRPLNAMAAHFHLSGSTLMILVGAFAGIKNVKRAYQVAIDEEYRFFSDSDAMLITRQLQSLLLVLAAQCQLARSKLQSTTATRCPSVPEIDQARSTNWVCVLRPNKR